MAAAARPERWATPLRWRKCGQGLRPDWVVFGSSSGGTHAGLVLGKRLFGYEGKLLGISIDEPEARLKAHVARWLRRPAKNSARASNSARRRLSPATVTAQAGYGVFGEAEREAITLFARYEGILLDPVYTGRAAAGLIDLIRQGFFQKRKPSCSGTPAVSRPCLPGSISRRSGMISLTVKMTCRIISS